MQKELKKYENELMDIVKTLYENPEIGNEEFKSSELLANYLKDKNFNVTKPYIVETGFRAEYISQKPGRTIAFLCEYDALPGIGHGCGHNLIAAIGIGAALALKAVIEEIGGKIIVLGTPAEENFGGKVKMVEDGAFNDIDVALMAHPNNDTKFKMNTLALKPLKFEFHGKTSHASGAPEKGINALDAAVLTYININMLRQYLPSHARIHGIIRDGGKAANIIPDYASIEYYFRGINRSFVEDLANKAIECAKAACLTTGCTFTTFKYEEQYDNLIANETLMNVYKKHYFDIGRTDFVDDDSIGSTDLGNVSYVIPVIHPYVGIGGDIIGHSTAMADQTITELGKKGMLDAALCLAKTAYDVIVDDTLFTKIMEEFKNNVKNS